MSSVMSSSASVPHQNVALETCPVCEQQVPNDRIREVKRRLDARERTRTEEVTGLLRVQHIHEQEEALSHARAEAALVLKKERDGIAEKIASAEANARKTFEADLQEQIGSRDRVHEGALAALRIKLDNAEAHEASATNALQSLESRLVQQQMDSDSALEQLRKAATANEARYRLEAQQTVDADTQRKITDLEQSHQSSEMALRLRIEQAETSSAEAMRVKSALQQQLDEKRREQEQINATMQEDARIREDAIRAEASAAAQVPLLERIANIELAKAEMESKVVAANQQLVSVANDHVAQMTQRLQEQRDAYEAATLQAVNAEKSAAYEDKLKWSSKIDELQRSIDKKTAEELGENAELDLYEVLKSEFDGDKIERVAKGHQGADILHVVMHNGQECGTIIYDSKDHGAWRNDFVAKLSSDQLAARAAHAILSTRKFPAGTRHLHVQDGVILIHPTHVAALVHIVRQHLVHTHSLRLSAEQRTQKTAALYNFMTSERCADMLKRIDHHAEDLLEMQVQEKKTHDTMWKNQGKLIRAVQKVRAELCNEVEIIIGTSSELPVDAR